MGSITTPPPSNPFVDGRQVVYQFGPRVVLDNDAVDANQGNWAIGTGEFNTSGTAGIVIASSTLNAVTRTPRVVRSARGAGANVFAGIFVVAGNSAAQRYNLRFPGQVRDSGIKMVMWGGIDANASTLATTQFLFGGLSALNRVPQPGNGLTAAGNAWLGMYSDATGDVRFGYKNVGGAVTRLDGGSFPNLWGAYTFWRFEMFCNPNTLRTTYSLSYMNAAGTALVSAIRGSTGDFNPGRFPVGPNWFATRATGGETLDMWMANCTLIGYPFGGLSL